MYTNEEALQVFMQNKNLVHYILKIKYNQYQFDEDMIQEGMIGLWKACQTFDEDKGYKFATYAAICIVNEIRMAYRKVKKHSIHTISLEDPVPDQEDLTFADTIEDPLGSVEDSGVFFNVFYETLSDNEKKVIELKLYGYRQEDAARMMGITQGGFSRIKNRILDKYMGRRKHENQKPVQRKDNDMGSV